MLSPQEQFKRARQAMSAGQTETARALFKQILAAHPNAAEALFHLGQLELQQGQAKRAKRYLQRALKQQPRIPEIWLALMDAEISLKNRKGITGLLKGAKGAGLPPGTLQQLQNKVATRNKRGVAQLVGISEAEFESARAAYMAGRFEEAEKIAAELLAKAHKNAPLHAIRAASLAQMRRIAEAKEAYEAAISIDPQYFEARMQYGQLLMGVGEFESAGQHLVKALEMAKDSPYAHLSMGILETNLNNSRKAIEHLEIARKSLPDEPRLQLYIAQAYREQGRVSEAREALEKAEEFQLRLDESVLLAQTLKDLEETGRAGILLDKLIEQYGKTPELLGAQANLFSSTGQIKEMRAVVRDLVEMGRAQGGQLLSYARSGKMAPGDPVAAEMERVFKEPGEEEDTQVNLAFALAKTHDDWGNYKKSFEFLRMGNDAIREKYLKGSGEGGDSFKTIKTIYERSLPLWDKASAKGHTNARPRSIQITGMPRSGTTLVEQIVSSHSRVEAAGEVGFVNNQAREKLDLLEIEDKPLTPEGLAELGRDITKTYHNLFEDAEYVTDKAILSNRYAGFFARALPEGRMVVLRRDPRDNCLSMYKNRFSAGSHLYSTDLESLARKYLDFLRIQDYWREKAPDSFYEIRYETLVENPEEETRRLIDYCGLEWEDSCLEFYKNKRQVKTLSAFQVRQKLYSSSIGAWKNYEDELQPLIRILDKGGALEGY